MATSRHTWEFKVREYEVDSFGHVNNAVYLQYLEQAAVEATVAAGFDMAWYAREGTAWVIRKMIIEYLAPALAGDHLSITTWVSKFGRVRANREYEIRRVADGLLLVRAQADWVYVDRTSLQPARLPRDLLDRFEPEDQVAIPHQPFEREKVLPGPVRQYIHRRRVERFELDGMRHVNNAVYLCWLEQAVVDACADAGWPDARQMEAGFAMLSRAHQIEYFHPAVKDDQIEIISRIYSGRRVSGTWYQEVRRAGTGEVLVSNYNTGASVDISGPVLRPRPVDPAFVQALVTPL
ncbi:MAG: hypothetical protein EXR62_01290 [Chloroflexi bacterium]|nr:hypothetical protein [Chloroflexota bacterium]